MGQRVMGHRKNGRGY